MSKNVQDRREASQKEVDDLREQLTEAERRTTVAEEQAADVTRRLGESELQVSGIDGPSVFDCFFFGGTFLVSDEIVCLRRWPRWRQK